jgi:hypothetical protein
VKTPTDISEEVVMVFAQVSTTGPVGYDTDIVLRALDPVTDEPLGAPNPLKSGG